MEVLNTKCDGFNTSLPLDISSWEKSHKHKVHVLIKVQVETLVERMAILSFCWVGGWAWHLTKEPRAQKSGLSMGPFWNANVCGLLLRTLFSSLKQLH